MKHPRTAHVRNTATAVATASALVLCLTPNAVAQTTENQVTFSVSNFSDFHGHLEEVADSDTGEVEEAGAALIAGKIDALRAEAVAEGSTHFHTTSGDNVGGSAFTSALLNDEPTIDVLNAMGVDVSAAGNHEFDQGFTDLRDRIVPNSEFPILGANVVDAKGEAVLEEYTIKEVENAEGDSISVAFIGTVTEQTKNKVAPSAVEGLEFLDPEIVTNEIAAELSDGEETNGEADVVIALFHEDGETATTFSEDVDAVFAGDSHARYLSGENSQPVIVQALEYGKLLANLDFTVDADSGEIISIEPSLFTADEMAKDESVTPNVAVTNIVEQAVVQAEIEGAKVVASIEHTFTRGANPGEESGSNRGIESTLNNLIAEAQRSQMSEFVGQDIDLGLMNAGGVRADLEAGDVTYAEAFTVQPFGNAVAYGTLSGADILQALEQQWKDSADSRPRLSLGVSDNFSYTYDPTAAAGERIIQAAINDEPLDPTKDYTVAASTFLFEGGDGFSALENVRNFEDVGAMDVQMFIDHLAEAEDLEPRWGQSDIGISVTGDLAPGSTVTIDLESLAYSQNETATEVTIKLGEEEFSAAIDTTVISAGYGSTGTAQFADLVVPESFQGGVEDIIITTDAAAPQASEDPQEPEEPQEPTAGSIDSPTGGVIAAAVAAVAAIAGALGLANLFNGGQLFAEIQANIQREVARFLG